jgi:Flp pilus assembly protein TadB
LGNDAHHISVFSCLTDRNQFVGPVRRCRFLRTSESLRDADALAAFRHSSKEHAGSSLRVGLVIWGLMSALIVLLFGVVGVLVVGAVAVLLFLLGRSTKKLEMKARSLSCADPQLESEYRHVGQSWSSKLLPDF